MRWAAEQGAHVTQTAPGDPEGHSVPLPGAADVILLDPAERSGRGLEGQGVAVRDHLAAGAYFAAQPLGGGGGFLVECADAGRLSATALAKHRLASSGGQGGGGAEGGRGRRGAVVGPPPGPGLQVPCRLWRAALSPRPSLTATFCSPWALPPLRCPWPAGVLLLADFLLLRHCPPPKLSALAAALKAGQARHGAPAPPPPDARWALGMRADALAAAPAPLAGLVTAVPFRPLTQREASRAKPGCNVPEVVRDAVKAWHNAPDLRYAIVVTPDAADVAGAPDAAALVEGLHSSAWSQRTVLSGGVSEVTEFLRLLAG
jgi:hypothetical protein